MRTKQEYINGLKKMKRNIYFDGQLIDRDDELQLPVWTLSERLMMKPPSRKMNC